MASSAKSFAMVGSPTTTKPASKLLIPVMQVTDIMTTAVVPFETFSCPEAMLSTIGGRSSLDFERVLSSVE